MSDDCSKVSAALGIRFVDYVRFLGNVWSAPEGAFHIGSAGYQAAEPFSYLVIAQNAAQMVAAGRQARKTNLGSLAICDDALTPRCQKARYPVSGSALPAEI